LEEKGRKIKTVVLLLASEVHHQASQRKPRNHHAEPHLQRIADRVVSGWQCPEQNEGAAAEVKLSAQNAPRALDLIQLWHFHESAIPCLPLE